MRLTSKRNLPFVLIGVFGVAIIVRTATLGGGLKLATGYLVGVAFISYAIARFMMARNRD